MNLSQAFVGVDPGANETGVVLRHHGELLWHETVLRRDQSLPRYLEAVVMACNVAAMRAPGRLYVLGVETVNAPNPHMGMMNPKSLIGTAMVVGAVLASFGDALLVPPGGNGSGPLTAYPEALRPTRGKGAGKDRLRHCRSAWDVSLAAEKMLRVGAA